MLEVKYKGMGNEKYVRVEGCCPCRKDYETCNFCVFRPKYPEKHKHKFFYWKTITRTKWFGLSKTVIRLSKCPCGEIKKEVIK